MVKDFRSMAYPKNYRKLSFDEIEKLVFGDRDLILSSDSRKIVFAWPDRVSDPLFWPYQYYADKAATEKHFQYIYWETIGNNGFSSHIKARDYVNEVHKAYEHLWTTKTGNAHEIWKLNFDFKEFDIGLKYRFRIHPPNLRKVYQDWMLDDFRDKNIYDFFGVYNTRLVDSAITIGDDIMFTKWFFNKPVLKEEGLTWLEMDYKYRPKELVDFFINKCGDSATIEKLNRIQEENERLGGSQLLSIVENWIEQRALKSQIECFYNTNFAKNYSNTAEMFVEKYVKPYGLNLRKLIKEEDLIKENSFFSFSDISDLFLSLIIKLGEQELWSNFILFWPFSKLSLLTLPEIFLVFSLILIFFIFVVIYSYKKTNLIKPFNGLFLMVLVFQFYLVFLNSHFGDFYLYYYFSFMSDSVTNLFKYFLIVAMLLSSFLFFSYFKLERIHSFEYIFLVFNFFLGVYFLISSVDLFFIYLCLELQSLAMYILVSYRKDSNFSTEAGLKYFILNAFSSSLLLFGVSFVYGFTGSLNLNDLRMLSFFQTFSDSINYGFLVGLVLIVSGIMFKLSLFPFHFWAPDIYEGAPTVSVLLISTVSKLSVILIFFKVFFITFFDQYYIWLPYLIFSSIVSIAIGTLGAVYQNNIKRFLAYSSISHVGFIFLGVSTCLYESFISSVFYFFIYCLTLINLFSVVFSLRRCTNNLKFKNFDDLLLIYKSNTALAFSLSISLFSLAGIPPLSGFFAKLSILNVLVDSLNFNFIIFFILFSVLSAFYYLKIIKTIYFRNSKKFIFLTELTFLQSLVILLTVYFNMFFIFIFSSLNLYLNFLLFDLIL